MNSMLHKYRFYDKYEGVRIYLPRTLVIATDCFDEFIRENGLQYVINSDISDDEILSEFVSSRLPESLVDDPANFHPPLVETPLARAGRVRNWRTRTTSPLPVSIRLI